MNFATMEFAPYMYAWSETIIPENKTKNQKKKKKKKKIKMFSRFKMAAN